MTLYELTAEFQELLDMAQDGDLDEKVLKDTFEAFNGEFEAKCDAYAKIMQQLKADSEALAQESARLDARRTSIDNNITHMKETIQNAMQATGKTKFKTTLFSFGIQKNGGVKPLVIDYCPDEFLFHPDPTPDKTKIREYLDSLKDGENCTWAHYGERGESLRIR